MSRLLSAALLSAVFIATGAMSALAAQPSSSRGLSITIQKGSAAGESIAIKLRLPSSVAAVDGRVLFDTNLADVVGVAASGPGTALAPEQIAGGASFGAFGLAASGGSTVLNIVVAPRVEGQIQFRIVIDGVADANGSRVSLTQAKGSGVLLVGNGSARGSLSSDVARALPTRGGWGVRDLFRDGTIGKLDMDLLRASWASSRGSSTTCAAGNQGADANGDGCIDVVDLQAVLTKQGHRAVNGMATSDLATEVHGQERNSASAGGGLFRPSAAGAAAAAVNPPFVVTSTADTSDSNTGDGMCADSQGRCTLRAAITESNWQPGDNTINFNMQGTAPVVIQMSSAMSLIQDRSGSLMIDGYSQPGSHVNTATVGSNAVPGVELRGTAGSPRDNGLFVTSANNTIRGFLFTNHYRSVYLDGVDAHDNHIVGNFVGFTANGALTTYRGTNGIRINLNAHNNFVGSPALADRNVIGNYTHAVDLYGPDTDYNTIQGNVLCMTPSGAVASCSTAIDHNFGPSFNLHGGTNLGERNIIGPTSLNGIEVSHGWDPDVGSARGSTPYWQNSGNRIIGNWIGFRADGSYNANYLSGQNSPNSNDANGVNVYDGSTNNLVEGNWIGARWDGVNTMSPTSTGNIIRNNIIGESPLGQAAPIGRYGINVRAHTKTGLIEGNIIRNAAVYGIALTQWDVLWFKLSRNIITDMTGPAIYLMPDPNNSSKGANNLLPAPQISVATNLRASGTGIAGSTVEVYRATRPAGQSGLPVAFLGSAVVANNGTWTAQITAAAGERLTALQINPKNNTSALGINVTVVQEQAGAPDVAADAFGRTVNNGWGNADTGGVYTLQGTAANYNVGNGTGTIQVPTAGGSRSALLTSPSKRDVDIKFRVSADQVGGGQYIVYAVGRRNGTSEYRARLIFNANGTVSVHGSRVNSGTEASIGPVVVVPGLAQSANSFIWVHAQVTGTSPTTVRVNAWADGQSEPAGWLFTATDSQASVQVAGSVGLRVWLNGSVPIAPVTFRFDDYSVATAN